MNPAQQVATLRIMTGSETAVAAIIENGQFDDLLNLIDGVKQEPDRRGLRQQLMTRKAYIKWMSNKKLLTESLADLEFDEDWMRSRGYLTFIASLDLADVKAEPALAAHFWKFAMRLEREFDRRDCVVALIQSPWFFPLIDQQDQLELVTGSIEKILEKRRLPGTVQAWIRSPGSMYFLTPERISFVLDFCELLSEKDQRDAFRLLGHAPHVQNWFAGEGQPDKLLKIVAAIKDEQRRGLFFDAVLSSSLLYKQQSNQELPAKLIEFASGQPQRLAAQMAISLSARYTDLDEKLESKLRALIVPLLVDGQLDSQTLRRIAGSHSLGKLVVQRNLRASWSSRRSLWMILISVWKRSVPYAETITCGRLSATRS